MTKTLQLCGILWCICAVHGSNLVNTFDVRMPGVKPSRADAYLCTGHKVPGTGSTVSYITKFEPLADMDIVHHMIVTGCNEPASRQSYWPCGAECSGPSAIMYAWAKNAPSKSMPKDVGFKIGGRNSPQYIVVQIHYKAKFSSADPPDRSGIRLHVTQDAPSQIGGIFLLGAMGPLIPPLTRETHSDISCEYEGSTELHPFGFRTHAHELGRVIFGYQHNNTGYHLIGKGSPVWAQSFYPANDEVVIKPKDVIAARCIYDSSGKNRRTRFGSTNNDEMCNFYIMYYTTAREGSPFFSCWGNHEPKIIAGVPLGSNDRLPETPPTHFENGLPKFDTVPAEPVTQQVPETDTAKIAVPEPSSAESADNVIDLKVQENWLSPEELKKYSIELGQVSGVATDVRGNLYIFHRGPVKWDSQSFRGNTYAHQDKKITQNTIIQVDREGKVVDLFGNDFYFMPHGISIDPSGRLWTTDVALHQVFRYDAGATVSTFSVGERFVHGDDRSHFCKPADVAVLPSGEFFVADGYCNSRVVKFDASGKFISSFGKLSAEVGGSAPAPMVLNLPHSVTVSADMGLVWVADRENGRLQCFDANTMAFKYETKPGIFGSNVFAVAFCPLHGGMLFAVNANERRDPNKVVQGFTLRASDGKLLKTWGKKQKFGRLHDVTFFGPDESVFVADLDGSGVTKFTTVENLALVPTTLPPIIKHKDDDLPYKNKGVKNVDTSGESGADKDKSSRQASLIIGLLLVIPVVFMVTIAIVVKCCKQNKRSKGYTLVPTL